MRAISAAGFRQPATADVEAGAAPMLQWVPIEQLVVDETYQRPIANGGKTNVQRIADKFRWSRFAPVVVSPVQGGKFAIVDGQHRTTAALLVGMTEVPCQVIVAGQKEQAEAFSAINGAVTKMSRLALHKAAVAAGDPDAVQIEAVAARAGIKVLRYPKAELQQEPGETMAVGALGDCIKACGERPVVLALRCIRETKNNVKGGLLGPIVIAMSRVVHDLPVAIRADQARVIAAFAEINVIREYSHAQMGERQKGQPLYAVLAARLNNRLADELAEKAA